MKKPRPIRPCKSAIWNGHHWTLPPGIYPKKIRKRKERHSKADKIYFSNRRWFLAKPENERCPIALMGLIKNSEGICTPHHRAATTVHHVWKRGRYYLEESTWLAASLEGHAWIEAHKNEARKLGWLCDTEETKNRWRASHAGLPRV
jgi:hypothetical protein